MSKCSIVRDLLPIYDDKALSAETTKAVKAHLGMCAGCREYYAHIHNVTRAMQDQESHSNYRYSGVVKRIRQKNITDLLVGMALVSVACIGFFKALSK